MRHIKKGLRAAASFVLGIIAAFALVCMWLVIGALLDDNQHTPHPIKKVVTV